MIKKTLKRIVLSVLSLKNFTIEKMVEAKKVKTLISKLAPFETGFELLRLGPKGDGGYLVPDDLIGIEACFSPGVGQLSGFEEECLKRDMKVFMADNSVDSPALKNDKFVFLKKHIGPISNNEFVTLTDWVEMSAVDKNSDLLLQMDIEGSEYMAIITMPETLLKRFRIVIVEFHDLQKLWNKEFYEKAETAFSKILTTHTCVHIHPNNCCGIHHWEGISIPVAAEFTFLRNDRIHSKYPTNRFPHPLDFDCTDNAHIVLPEDWYRRL